MSAAVRRVWLGAGVCLLWLLVLLGQHLAAAEGRRTLDVLFVGNSYTYVNNLGDVVAGLARSLTTGPAIAPTLVVRGGMTLQWHLATRDAAAAIQSRHWDYVILQEQSSLGGPTEDGQPRLSPPGIFHTSVRAFVPIIRAADSTPLLFMTWAYRDRENQQPLLTSAYDDIGRELDVEVSPVGLAWQEARTRWPAIDLFREDGSHPSPAGSYLAACVLYASMVGNPLGATASIDGHPYSRSGGSVDLQTTVPRVRISDVDARRLQQVAWETITARRAAAR